MMAGEVSLTVEYPIAKRVGQINVGALLDVGRFATSQTDFAAIFSNAGVQVDTLIWRLCSRQTPFHT